MAEEAAATVVEGSQEGAQEGKNESDGQGKTILDSGTQPDLSDKGLREILDGKEPAADQSGEGTGDNKAPAAEGTPTPAKDEDVKKDGEGEENWVVPGKFKSVEDTRKGLKDNERYIGELQQENKDLKEKAEKPPEPVATKEAQPQLSKEEIAELNERTRESFDSNPTGTIFDISYTAINQVLTKELAPIKEFINSLKQDNAITGATEGVKDITEIKDRVRAVLTDHPELAKMGKKGAELAVKIAKGENLEDAVKRAYELGSSDKNEDAPGVPTNLPMKTQGTGIEGEPNTPEDKQKAEIFAASSKKLAFME